MRRGVRAGFAAVLLAAGCSGPPWYMGSPLDGRASIPGTTARRSWKQQRAEAARARAAGEAVHELAALLALDEVDRLLPEHRPRLVALLERRAADFHALGRAVAESRDLERLARVSPAHGAGLLGERAAAARAAGDAFLAIGEIPSAREAYGRARALGAADLDVRVTALWGHPPSEATPLAELRAAILALPLRAVPPFAGVYVARGGADPAVLARGLAGARQEGQVELAARLEAAMNRGAGAAADADGGADNGELAADASMDSPSAAGGGDAAADGAGEEAHAPKARMPAPADLPGWLVSGPTVEGRFLPLARAHPELLADAAGVARLVDLMLAEDPTSTEVLELAAATFGRLGRFGGTERMLGELVYQTPDRAAGLARAARVWERLGRTREACVQWLRAARWRDDAEDPTWHTALACARREPGVADWREIRAYVIARARPDRRAAITATLDAL